MSRIRLALRSTLPFALPVLVGALLRAAWLALSFHVLVSDEVAYHELAARLAQGEPYGVPFWPPGWPALLALLYRAGGPSPTLGLLANLLFSTGVIVLTGAIAQRLFGRTAALAALWISALMPSYVLPVTLLRYEIYLQFVLALGLWFALATRSPWRWVAAVVCATVLATFMRPMWLLLPPLLWLAALPQRRAGLPPVRWQHVLLAQSLAVLLVLPWVAAASAQVGRFVPVALNGGINLWIGNNPKATGGYIAPPGEYWDPRNDAEATRVALEYMRSEPARVLALLPRKVYLSFAGEPWAEWVFLSTARPFPPATQGRLQVALNAYYWLVLLTATTATLWLAVRREAIRLLPLLLVAYSVATQLPFFGTPRFRWTVQFVIVAFAAGFAQMAAEAWHARRSAGTALGLP